jgi:hypothetical protein
VVTPQSQYLGRRHFLKTCGLGLAASALLPVAARAATFGFPDSLNAADKLPGVKLTPYDDITGYNNFYEWGLDKGDPKVNANRGWKTEPWVIDVGGYRPLVALPARGAGRRSASEKVLVQQAEGGPHSGQGQGNVPIASH